MKKIRIILALTVFCSFTSLAQLNTKTEKAEINLQKVRKINYEFPEKLVNEDGTADVPRAPYTYDGLLLRLTYGPFAGNQNYLSSIQTGVENRRKRANINDNYYQASIQEINKNKVLIRRSMFRGHGQYSFDIVNNSYSYRVWGYLEFQSGEEAKAKAILDEILNGIKLKD